MNTKEIDGALDTLNTTLLEALDHFGHTGMGFLPETEKPLPDPIEQYPQRNRHERRKARAMVRKGKRG
jgi:hypothetical protein